VRVGCYGTLAVIDHGPGIPFAHRDRLFNRFWRAPGTTRGGAGLGLAIVTSVAAAHEATVAVEDTPGGGATFVLALRSLGKDESF
jgi:two-component system OmpR family sensor kinase